MAKLEAGDNAPAFTLPDQDGKPVKLTGFKGQQVIVYFYPADDTPGCTKEACQFNDNLKAFEKAGVAVLGISPDKAEKHVKFRTKYKLKFPLLTDADKAVMEKYGAWGEKTMYGKKTVGTIRSTFLVGPERQDPAGLVQRAGGRTRGQGARDPRRRLSSSLVGRPLSRPQHLVGRTPVGRSPAHDGTSELGPVAGASSTGPALLHELAHVRPTPATEPAQSRANGLVQHPQFGVAEWGATLGIQAGPPQHLVGQEVADAGQSCLIQQPGLERGRAAGPRRRPGQSLPELGQGDGERIGPESALVGRQLQRAEAAGIVHPEMPPVGEADARPYPLLVEEPGP